MRQDRLQSALSCGDQAWGSAWSKCADNPHFTHEWPLLYRFLYVPPLLLPNFLPLHICLLVCIDSPVPLQYPNYLCSSCSPFLPATKSTDLCLDLSHQLLWLTSFVSCHCFHYYLSIRSASLYIFIYCLPFLLIILFDKILNQIILREQTCSPSTYSHKDLKE